MHRRKHIALADELASQIEADPDFEFTTPANLALLTFRYRPAGLGDAGQEASDLEQARPADGRPVKSKRGQAGPDGASVQGSGSEKARLAQSRLHQARPAEPGLDQAGPDDHALNALNERLLHALNDSGRLYLTQTRVRGRYVIRFAIGQRTTEPRHVQAAWQLIQETARSLAPDVDRPGPSGATAHRPRASALSWRSALRAVQPAGP